MSTRGPRRTSFPLRSVFYFLLVFVTLAGLTGWLAHGSAQRALTEQAATALATEARIAEASMPSDPNTLQAWVEEMFSISDRRWTAIDADGVVLADSHADPSVMENHAGRPEVEAALAGGTGQSIRQSESTGFEQLYVAIPADGGMVLRVSVPTRDLTTLTWPYLRSLMLFAVVVGVLGAVLVDWRSRRIAAPMTELTQRTLALADGQEAASPRSHGLSEVDQLALAIHKLDDANRNRLAEANRASETFEVVLGAIPQGTVLFAENDDVVYANPSAHGLLGLIPDNLTGLAPYPFQTAVRECRQTRSPVTRMVEHGKPVRLLMAAATPFIDDARALLVVVDVTDQERSGSVRRDFVANASHELKTPVSAIIASSEALQMAVERGDDSSIGFARQIDESARQLDRLVTDLLDLSRLERDRPELDPLSLDLLLREEVERIRPLAEEREIALSCEAAPVRVAGSRRDVAIAVRNLLDNAIRHTGRGGEIGAGLTTDNGEVLLRISDTGEGIPTRDLTRVFERFYRVDSARSRGTGGTGLGLAIVKHVIESHGGSVEVESELGVGSTFVIRLPVLEEESTGVGLA